MALRHRRDEDGSSVLGKNSNGKGGWSKSTRFTHLGGLVLAPVPVPSSVLLMGSTLALFPLFTRRRRAARA